MSTPKKSHGPADTIPHPLWIVLIFVVVNSALGATIALFCWTAFKAPAQGAAAEIARFIGWGNALALPIDVVIVGGYFMAPYRRVRIACMRSVPLAEIGARDLRRTLQLQSRLLGFSLAKWLVSAAVWAPYALRLESNDMIEVLALSIGSALCFGHISAVLTFYFVFSFTQRWVAPIVLKGGRLEPVGRFRPVRIYHHVLLLILSLGLVQPALGWTLLSGNWVDREVAVGFVAALTVIVSIIQGAGMLSAMARPAGNLDGRMAEVAEGRLDVAARVENVDTFGRLASSFNMMVEGLRQREHIRETFGRYVTQQVAEEILSGDLELGGELRVATVLFSDIRGFTRMSEKMSPEEVVEFLNCYLDLMVDCVLDTGGTLDKFIGDAVMAVFGVPLSKGPAEDARSAVACALRMNERLRELNREREAAGQAKIEIGIGLHSGPLVAGNIGSAKRMEYTVIGDTVNLTSRLEGLTKSLGASIVISEEVAKYLKHDVKLEALDEISVRGREQKVKIFSVTAPVASP